MDQETAMLRPQTGQSDASNLSTATDTELGARVATSSGLSAVGISKLRFLCRGVGFCIEFRG